MSYSVVILRRAQKEMASLPSDTFDRIRQALRRLSNVPRPAGCVKLIGREGWRIRVGNYQVLYEIDDTRRCVTIFHVGHRRDVYRIV